MTERPILFSAPMVRAILAGTKTQTRRVAKGVVALHERTGEPLAHLDSTGPRIACPFGKPGDRLWVRETFAHIYRDNTQPEERRDDDVAYKADHQGLDEYAYGTWKPSIHMPRWASRIDLLIIGVRVERLQDISIADAMAEGVVECNPSLRGLGSCMEWRYAYEDLWTQINGPGSWDLNPWVWVVEFKRLEA